ncbi:unnamed protein product [Nippostrongylus brasiliensis]|uniref:Tektin n=1 Tax=Nippostrongylus brasiliensis TaxID=27835 RepID=A0A0N4XQP7_NIPBR|nr:unnamed protein product [Nippostrongylus brasiliensis]
MLSKCSLMINLILTSGSQHYKGYNKEEHDDMITRVHTLEQEKVQLNFQTQNQVLRRELERVTALLREREARCVCLKGMPLSTDLRAESPVDVRSNRYDTSFTII